MLSVGRLLPGELDGTFDPRDYGFDVIAETRSLEDITLGAAQFYRSARARTGVEIPRLDHLLRLQPYDTAPAQALQDRYRDIRYPYACEFGTARLEVDKGVFCPDFTSASPLLLNAVDFKPTDRVLDAFTGSGALGLNAALQGARVVAFDVSPAAVACAKKNAALNGVSQQFDARVGTLATCIAPGETFDLVVANPPLIPIQPKDGLEVTLFDEGLQATKDLIAALPQLLGSRGRCYLLSSDVIDRNGYECDIAALCRNNGLRMTVVAQLHKEYESYRVHKIEHRQWLGLRRLVSLHS